MTDTNHTSDKNWFQRVEAWGEQRPKIKRYLKVALITGCGLLACIWIFAWLVKYHHVFGLYWKS